MSEFGGLDDDDEYGLSLVNGWKIMGMVLAWEWGEWSSKGFQMEILPAFHTGARNEAVETY